MASSPNGSGSSGDSTTLETSFAKLEITPKSRATRCVVESRCDFFQDMKTLFESNTGDVTIVGRKKTWKVHSAILAARCHFFKVAFLGPFQEAQTRTLTMDHDDPVALGSLLEYLYTGSYIKLYKAQDKCTRGTIRGEVEVNSILKSHSEVFTLADKYGVLALKELARAAIILTTAQLAAMGNSDVTRKRKLDEDDRRAL